MLLCWFVLWHVLEKNKFKKEDELNNKKSGEDGESDLKEHSESNSCPEKDNALEDYIPLDCKDSTLNSVTWFE